MPTPAIRPWTCLVICLCSLFLRGLASPVKDYCSRYSCAYKGKRQYGAISSSSSDTAPTAELNGSSITTLHTIKVPVDHFHNDSTYEPHSNDTFGLRYAFDAQFYRDGGPVILLVGGESDITQDLPLMQDKIVYDLARATNGVLTVLEHRYYGHSFPTPDLSTANLRFLTLEQAMADAAYFVQHVQFPGLESVQLTAPETSYIAYGASYAGALVAFLRTTYPHLFYGAIASSAVVEAMYDYWQYYEPIRLHAPAECIRKIQQLTSIVDAILLGTQGPDRQNHDLTSKLKSMFNLQAIRDDADFASVLTFGVRTWQNRDWYAPMDDPMFNDLCKAITSPTAIFKNIDTTAAGKLLSASKHANASLLLAPWTNYIGFIRDTIAAVLPASQARQAEFLSRSNPYTPGFFTNDSLAAWSWRSWTYQRCTAFASWPTGSGVPTGQAPLISRLITLEYQTNICRTAFNISPSPDVITRVNRYGGRGIAYDKLAFVDGSADPWIYETVHAPGGPARQNTVQRPYMLMRSAVHHWDETTGPSNATGGEPSAVKQVQAMEVQYVQAWLREKETDHD